MKHTHSVPVLVRSVGLVVLVCVVFVPRLASAQDSEKVKAFQNAINYAQNSPKGTCRSIPYPDYEDACTRKQAEVDKWCEGWSCKGMDPVQMQRRIEALKTQRDEAKAKKEDLERQRSSATDDAAKRDLDDKIGELNKQIDDVERQRDPIEKEVDEASKQISDLLYRGKYCRDSRENVMEVYRNAKSRAGSETDTAVVPLAKRLITYWESTEAGHAQEITDVKNGIEKCNNLLDDIGHLGRLSLVPDGGKGADSHRAGLSGPIASYCLGRSSLDEVRLLMFASAHRP